MENLSLIQTIDDSSLNSFGSTSFYANSKKKNFLFKRQIDFNSKLKYDAIKFLNLKRGDGLVHKLTRPTVSNSNQTSYNILEIKPIDFSLKQYKPNPLTKQEIAIIKQQYVRKSLQSKQRAKSVQIPRKYLDDLKINDVNKDKKDFDLKTDKTNPQTERVNVIKDSIFNAAEPFQDMKDHDFRQTITESIIQPEFIKYVKSKVSDIDYKIEFVKLQLQKNQFNDKQIVIFKNIQPGPQIGEQPKTPEPKYDTKLVLPIESYPEKHHEYTRHKRLNRSVHSAFLERVEEKFNKKFQKNLAQFDLTLIEKNGKDKELLSKSCQKF